jgi:hypothetical protein
MNDFSPIYTIVHVPMLEGTFHVTKQLVYNAPHKLSLSLVKHSRTDAEKKSDFFHFIEFDSVVCSSPSTENSKREVYFVEKRNKTNEKFSNERMSLVFRLSCESFVGGPSFDI